MVLQAANIYTLHTTPAVADAFAAVKTGPCFSLLRTASAYTACSNVYIVSLTAPQPDSVKVIKVF